jgi:anti-anti-sigma regulatory factor
VGRIVVPVAQTLGMLEAAALGAQLATRMAGRPGIHVVCDLAGVHAATLATLQALALLALAARRYDGTLRLRNLSPQVRDALGLAGLWDELRLDILPPTDGAESCER